MDGFEWILYWLILIFKVIFLTDIPLTYIKIKKVKSWYSRPNNEKFGICNYNRSWF